MSTFRRIWADQQQRRAPAPPAHIAVTVSPDLARQLARATTPGDPTRLDLQRLTQLASRHPEAPGL